MPSHEDVEAEMSSDERALCEAVAKGEPSRSAAAEDSRLNRARVRADVLAQLILNPPEFPDSKPLRIVINGYSIVGQLDLGCGKPAPFLFENCTFTESPNLNDATASFVGFVNCKLNGLNAERLKCDGPVWLSHSTFADNVEISDSRLLELEARHIRIESKTGDHVHLDMNNTRVSNDVTISGSQVKGTVQAIGMTIGGSLFARHLVLRKPSNGPSGFDGSQARISGGLFLAPGFESAGPLYLKGSRIEGPAQLVEASISVPGGEAAVFDHSHFGLGLMLDKAKIRGTVRLHHAQIGCQLSMRDTEFLEPGGIHSLLADHTRIDGTVFADRGLKSEGSVDFHGSSIECHFQGAGLVTSSDETWGLSFDRALIKGDLQLTDAQIEGGLTLAAAAVEGSVALRSARIGAHQQRPSILMTRLTVGDGFSAVGLDLSGRVVGQNVTIGGNLDATDAKIGSDPQMRSLVLSHINVAGHLNLTRLKATGSVGLDAATIAGDLRLTDAQLLGSPAQVASRGNPAAQAPPSWRGSSLTTIGGRISGNLDARSAVCEEAIVLSETTVGRSVVLLGVELSGAKGDALNAAGLVADRLDMRLASKPSARVDLTNARLGTLCDARDSWPTGTFTTQGLRYQTLVSTATLEERLDWLESASSPHSPQPYEELAAQYESLGEDAKARRVRLRSIQRSYRTGSTTRRVSGWLQNVVLGYGYAPWRAVPWVLGLLAFGTIYFATRAGSCAYEGALHAGLCPKGANPPIWNPFLYTLDLLLPIVSIGQDTSWRTNGESQIVQAALILSGWVLVTAIVAAFTRFLRRSS